MALVSILKRACESSSFSHYHIQQTAQEYEIYVRASSVYICNHDKDIIFAKRYSHAGDQGSIDGLNRPKS